MKLLPFLLLCVAWSWWGTSTRAAETPATEALKEFSARVAPALAAKCVACHRADNLKGNFDLTTRAGLLKGGDGGAAVEPGKPLASPLYTRAIPHDGAKPEMPEKGEPLTVAEAAALREWIAAGAPWPDGFVLREKAKADASFWSFQPLANVEPPQIADAPPGWSDNPIDRFVLAKLREQGLEPNPPADAATLVRRMTYDLHGLPPTVESVKEWEEKLKAESRKLEEDHPSRDSAAFSSLLSALLSSPRYGEHWGRHWLDVIRFGESRGYERNEIITNLWPFRDYIIRSFNDDKPFDQLVREHLAGDVIGKDQPDVEIGSAFLVAGPYDDVGNQDPIAAAQIRADQMDEMIRATGEAFLGLTIGCARCHDHKFDPLLSQDYYAWYATFAGTFHGPRDVATASARAERQAKLAPLEAARAELTKAETEFQNSLTQRADAREAEVASGWTRPRVSRYGTEETFAPTLAKFVRITVDGTDGEDAKTKNFRLDEFEVWTDEAEPRNVALTTQGGRAFGASRDAKDFTAAYGASLTIDGKFGERWLSTGPTLTIELKQPERVGRVFFSSDRPRALAEDYGLTVFVGDYTIEVSTDGREWREVANSADRQPPSKLRKRERLLKLVTTDQDRERLAEFERRRKQIDAQIAAVPPLTSWWVGNHRAAPGPFNVFVGGNPQRKSDPVLPASLRVLGERASHYQLPAERDEAARRVALADWITARDNPLTARVLVNRIWHYHFGKGIVDTPSDFGYMGSRPTHPELLDWLAAELIRGGWKLKPIHRLIMSSATYRQSSTWREAASRQDGDSRLLWRFPPRRLTAEEVRDTLLSVAGKLDLRMGGPGFKLYEYLQDNVATYVPLDVHGPETYRRAVYHHNARAARTDLMTDFDCPDPAAAEPRRASTVTPLQALTLMNHRFALDMTAAFAERLQCESNESAEQVRRAFQIAYAREPVEPELNAAVRLIETHGLRAFCRAVLNSNELIHIN